MRNNNHSGEKVHPVSQFLKTFHDDITDSFDKVGGFCTGKSTIYLS